MRTLAEFLAGCPRPVTDNKTTMPWRPLRAFPGFMLRRMYILLTRPKQAIEEFGAGDYKTPFLFFLSLTIIIGFLKNFAFLLQMGFLPFLRPAGNTPMEEPGLSGFFHIIFNNSDFLVSGTLDSIVHKCLYLGIAVIILTLGLWFITGARSWNPAFTISAYCLPVLYLLSMVSAFAQIPWVFSGFLSKGLNLTFTIIGIILTVVIAGYGITALIKIPVKTAVIVAFCWIVIWMLMTGVASEFVILPVERGLRQMISHTFFFHPQSFPTDYTLGKNP